MQAYVHFITYRILSSRFVFPSAACMLACDRSRQYHTFVFVECMRPALRVPFLLVTLIIKKTWENEKAMYVSRNNRGPICRWEDNFNCCSERNKVRQCGLISDGYVCL
jgi:hypothetical protein